MQRKLNVKSIVIGKLDNDNPSRIFSPQNACSVYREGLAAPCLNSKERLNCCNTAA